jgi:hypothetical protein
MIFLGNPLMLPVQSPHTKTISEWLTALQGKEKCLKILFSKGIPYVRHTSKKAEAFLNFINGNGETHDKRIALDERVVDCKRTIWNISNVE